MKVKCDICGKEIDLSVEICNYNLNTDKSMHVHCQLEESVKKMLNQAASTELERANSLYPQFHSAHEAESVLREELEECADELESIQETLKYLWENIRSNDTGQQQSALNQLKRCAENIAIEVNQFRAMCEKAQAFYDKEGVE